MAEGSPPPQQRRSTSQGSPVLTPEHFRPSSPRARSRTSHSPRQTSANIGILRLSGEVSQNEERLSQSFRPATASGSDSSGNGLPDSGLTVLPYLDESPASYPTSHSFSQGSSQQSTIPMSDPRYANYSRYEQHTRSQSIDHLSYQDIGASLPEHAPELGDVSFSHHSSESISIQNTSSDSSANRSSNSRSSGSISDISFTNAETSTPRQTPIRSMNSQKSTPSGDSDIGSVTSQISPSKSLRGRSGSLDSLGTHVSLDSQVHSVGSAGSSASTTTTRIFSTTSRAAGSSREGVMGREGARGFPPIPENEVLSSYDESGSSAEFGTDPSHQDLDAAFTSESQPEPQPEPQPESQLEPQPESQLEPQPEPQVKSGAAVKHDGEGSGTQPQSFDDIRLLTTQEILSVTEASSKGKRRKGKEPKSNSSEPVQKIGPRGPDYLSSDDEIAASQSLTRSGVDLNISNIDDSVIKRSRHFIPPTTTATTTSTLITVASTSTTVTVAEPSPALAIMTKANMVTKATQTEPASDISSLSQSRSLSRSLELSSPEGLKPEGSKRRESKRKEPKHKEPKHEESKSEDSIESILQTHDTPLTPERPLATATEEEEDDEPISIPSSPSPTPSIGSGSGSGSLLTTRARRTPRSSRSSLPGLQNLPSSQGSTSIPSSTEAFMERLRSAAAQDDAPEHEFSEVPKRRKIKRAEQHEIHVMSSVGEDDFWEKSDNVTREDVGQLVRSRSGSRDIATFPEDFTAEVDELAPLSPTGEEGDEAAQESTHEPKSPHNPSAEGKRTPSPPRRVSRSRSGQARELRRRGSASQASASQSSQPSTTPTRRTLRRHQSASDGLRAYKTNDPVWAKWRRSFFPGKVVRRDNLGRYEIHFLDDDIATCESNQMRPLKLKLGAAVMARKTETMDYEATVVGMQILPEIEKARVDVQFEDESEANLSLQYISLTPDMLAKLDEVLEWDQDDTHKSHSASQSHADPSSSRGAAEAGPSEPPVSLTRSLSRQASASLPAVPLTPTRGKGRQTLSQQSYGSPSTTPTRRNRGSVQPLGLSTPSRRAKGSELFKDFRFVLSLTGSGGSQDLYQTTATKIKNGGGTILPNFSSVTDMDRSNPPNVVLISYTTVRTLKFLEALALNVPRLSHQWIDTCINARELLSYQPFLLPTGFSKELGTVVSSTPSNGRGIFEGLEIGLCGSHEFRAHWERPLIAGGATVANVTPKTGPMNCNYIVFYMSRWHQSYCEQNAHVPTLSDEWLIQCLINQRVLAINGHSSYTDLESKKPIQSSASSSNSAGAASSSTTA